MLKILMSLLVLTSASLVQAQIPVPAPKVYGIHLFFNETEFIDVLTITQDSNGQLSGHMLVPNDFEGAVTGLQVTGQQIQFDLLVPKNASRPVDLIFHYEARFFDAAQKELIGFVTIKDQNEFVASFTGFLR